MELRPRRDSSRPPSAWRGQALVRIAELRCQAKRLGSGEDPLHACAEARLDDAERAAMAPRRLLAGWTGSAVEMVWRNIHSAEVMLLRLASDEDLQGRSAEIDAVVSLYMPATDRRRIDLHDRYIKNGGDLKREDRAQVVAAVDAAYHEYDDQRSRVRSFRNVLIVIGLVMLVSAVALALVTAFFEPTPLSLCIEQVCPTGRRQPSAGDVAFVEVLGATAALLVGATSISRLRGTSTPYALPVVASLFKAPTGALTAVFGLSLINGGFAPGIKPTSTAAIVGWALLFGAAQQTFTTLIDRQAQTVLNNVASTEKTVQQR